jgi:hypothetical protein
VTHSLTVRLNLFTMDFEDQIVALYA